MSDLVPAKNEARTEMGDAPFERLSIETRLSLSKSILPSAVRPLVVPIYNTSTYVFESVEQFQSPNYGGNFIYQRYSNPTQETAEVMIRELEHGAGTLVYNSGLAAVNALMLCFLSNGDHIICQYPLYTATNIFIEQTMRRFGIDVTWLHYDDQEHFATAVAGAIKKTTKMIYLETPCNPTMVMVDIESICRIAAKANVQVAVDATFASPYLLQPIRIGADFVLHSCSKYIGGHSDLVGGCVTTKSLEDWQKLKSHQMTTGSTMSPFESFLVIRGLKTLPLRMTRCSESATAVAQFLDDHDKVSKVWYPGLQSHADYAVAKRLMRMPSGMIAFDVGSIDAAVRLVESVRVITLAVSLGGTESLIEHPSTMTHAKKLGEDFQLPDGLIRLSIGLETADDLIADLRQALDRI